MSNIESRHHEVHRQARTAQVAPADVVTTLATMGETVEDLKARLPQMRDLHDWLVRIEARLVRIEGMLKAEKPVYIGPALDGNEKAWREAKGGSMIAIKLPEIGK